MTTTLTPTSEITAVHIPIGRARFLDADVTTPAGAKGVILFAHGSGSSRHSGRNRYVASELNQRQLATVLADLLTAEEEIIDERTRALRFDIPMLVRRMVKIIDWAHGEPALAELPIGLFGASTGAAAALDAAAERPREVYAVVSRGGRPDLADKLESVAAPTLLIVGGNDPAVLDLNEQAMRRLRTARKRLEIVRGASHLFEEPGMLEQVAALAGDWFAGTLQKGFGR